MDNLSTFTKCLNIESTFKIRVKLILHRCVVWTPFLVQFTYIFLLLNGDLDFKNNRKHNEKNC